MADISTIYMGIRLTSPIIVGASTFSRKIDNIKRAEDSGAGALVIYSLFQEQIEIERNELEDELRANEEAFPEALTYFPQMEHAGPREHIMWVEKTRKEVKFPLIASLNAISLGDWIEYAKQLENAGCDALELNLYAVETDPTVSSEDIEERQLDVVEAIVATAAIPVAVKLSPFYTSLPNFVDSVIAAGAAGVVLFNRFYQPFIDPLKEELDIRLDLSRSEDTRLPLRWIAILSEWATADFAASTGVHTAFDVARHLLAGAKAVQCVSTLYNHGLDYIGEMNLELSRWMDGKGYKNTENFRGKMSQKNLRDPYAFERAQYVKALLEYKQG
ncbi:MAG: dihydroorotate dehydrogenase-like protein [Armatimonadota bacterium]|nr:dihydroorotate dehydrogenase-like protein [bacterium]